MSATSARHRPNWPKILGIVALALLLLLALYLAITGWRAVRHARQLQAHASALKHLSVDQVATVGPSLGLLQGDLAALRRDLALPLALAPQLGWLPKYGATIQAAPDLLWAAEELLDSAAVCWNVLGPAIEIVNDQSTSGEPLTLAARQVEQHREELIVAAAQVAEAAVVLQSYDVADLDPRVAQRLAQFHQIAPLVSPAFDALLALPSLVEASDDQTWLLLAQNNEELRPSGGFISSIGLLRIENGLPELLSFQDSYRVENWSRPHPDPPDPLRKYMLLDLWVTRDANWWPDFPTSAQAVAELYELNQGQAVDGVVAVDMVAAARVLECLTPLKLADGRTIRRGAVAESFRQSWGLPADALLTNGDIVTATRPFEALEVELVYGNQTGNVCFDALNVERLADGGNLVSNPSFEQVADGDGRPDDWSLEGLTASDGLTSGDPYDGSHCLAIGGQPDALKIVRQTIRASGGAGDAFRVAAMSRADSPAAEGGEYALRVSFVSGDGERETTGLEFPILAHDWATSGSASVIGLWWRHRKDIINYAMAAATQKVLSQPSQVRWLDLAQVVWSLLEERHIQAYATIPEGQSLLLKYGWAGALREPTGDYLLLVDSNLGYNKVTSSVEQSLSYHVDLTGQPRARLVVSYRNTSTVALDACDKFNGQSYVPTYDALTQGCYWDYVRLYVPQGAELVASSGGDEAAEVLQEAAEVLQEAGKTVFATYLVLPPGRSRELVFEYRLPRDIIQDGRYTLLAQKQAGTGTLPFDVFVRGPEGLLPEDASVLVQRPAPDELRFVSDLRVDREFVVVLP